MSLQRFVTKGRVFEPKVSIHKDKDALFFSTAACRQFNINDYQYVILFYDPDNKRQVTLELTNNEEEAGTRKIRHQGNIGASVGLLPFLRFYNIQLDTRTTYSPEWDEKKKRITIYLDSPSSKTDDTGPSRSTRGRTRQQNHSVAKREPSKTVKDLLKEEDCVTA